MSWSESGHDAEALERERIASMADEGGTAAAQFEAQPAVARTAPPRRRGRPATAAMLVAAGFAAAVLLLALRRASRESQRSTTP